MHISKGARKIKEGFREMSGDHDREVMMRLETPNKGKGRGKDGDKRSVHSRYFLNLVFWYF